MLKPESRQADAFQSQSNPNEETTEIIKKGVQHGAYCAAMIEGCRSQATLILSTSTRTTMLLLTLTAYPGSQTRLLQHRFYS